MKINVYGTGKNAVKYVLENNDVEINSFIEGKNNKTSFMSELFLNPIPVLHVDDAYDNMKRYYTVIAASPTAYYEIKEKLESMGLNEFDDFCYYEIFRKKIAVIYGNCHTIPIKEIMSSSEVFSSEYGFYPLHPIYRMKKEDLNLKVFQKCDLFLHQCIREENEYGKEYASSLIIKKLKISCKVVNLPNVYNMPRFLYPQCISKERGYVWESYNYFLYRDYYLDKYYNAMSVDDLKNIILDENLIPHHEIINNMDVFFEKLKLREKEWDIKVSDFIYNNLKDTQLFYDIGHPSNKLLSYIANEALQILKFGSVDVFQNVYTLDDNEIPIYACVKKALNLTYNTPYMRKCSNGSINNQQMDLRQYIVQYLKWNHTEKR